MHQGQTPDQNPNHKASVHGGPPAGIGGPAAARPGRQPLVAPRPAQPTAETATGSPFQQQQQQPFMPPQGAEPLPPPGQAERRGSFLARPPQMTGSTPPRPVAGGAGRLPASPSQGQQNPFGQNGVPRPPGVAADKPLPAARAGVAAPVDWSQQGSAHSQPRSAVREAAAQHFTQGAGGAFGSGSPPPRSSAGSPMFGETSAASEGPTRSPTAQKSSAENGPPTGADSSATPGAGAAAVAKRLLNRGMGDGGVSTKGVPHVSSAPVLGERAKEPIEAGDPPEKRGSGGAAAGSGGGGDGGKGTAGEQVPKAGEQAPKSEPRKGAKGEGGNMKRRASVGGAAVAAKPGRLAKMMSKWLYPEAKVGAGLCVRNNDMLSYVMVCVKSP